MRLDRETELVRGRAKTGVVRANYPRLETRTLDPLCPSM